MFNFPGLYYGFFLQEALVFTSFEVFWMKIQLNQWTESFAFGVSRLHLACADVSNSRGWISGIGRGRPFFVENLGIGTFLKVVIF